jgi:hypothetical protein
MFLQRKIEGFRPAMFEDMVYGTAHKPYVCRALLPFGIRTVVSVIPEEVKNSINRKIIKNKTFRIMNSKWRWEKRLLTEYIIGCVFMYLALIGFFFAFRILFNTVYEASNKLLDLTSLLALLGLPVMFKYHSYIYDFGTLFLFTLGLALMAQKKWLLFLVIYTLACFNKETTILLTFLFVIYFGFYSAPRLNKSLLIKLLSAQAGIYLIVRLVLLYFFHDNPGRFLLGKMLFRHNLFLKPYTMGAYSFLVVVLMVLYKWDEKPIFLKCGLLMLIPLLTLCLFFGYLDELRDYYEVYPVVILLMAHTIGEIIQWTAKPRLEI